MACDECTIPRRTFPGGTRYLRELLNRFKNRVDLVLASYNAGEGAVAKFGNRVPPYRETRNYVSRSAIAINVPQSVLGSLLLHRPRIARWQVTVMKGILVTTFLCLSLLVTAAYGQQPDGPLTNTSVVRLVKAGFKEKTIIAIINNRPSDFKLDTEQLISLKRNGVTENVILAMLSSQLGTVIMAEDEWGSNPFFKDFNKSGNGDSPAQGGESSIFGSGSEFTIIVSIARRIGWRSK